MNQIDLLREQIDACRPGSDDLALPALAELAQAVEEDCAVAEELVRSRAFDRAVAAAMHDVPVPPGLLDRLLAATQAAASVTEVTLPAAASGHADRAGLRHPITRRQWVLASGSVALAVIVVVSAYRFWLWPPHHVTQGELGVAVATWLGQLNAKAWTAVVKGTLPKDVPFDTAVRGTPQRWQKFQAANASGLSANVVAIDLAPPGQPHAILLVVRSSARFAVPPTPTATTRLVLSGRFQATAWQKPGSNLLFVLAVEEDRGQRLDDYLHKRPEA